MDMQLPPFTQALAHLSRGALEEVKVLVNMVKDPAMADPLPTNGMEPIQQNMTRARSPGELSPILQDMVDDGANLVMVGVAPECEHCVYQ